MLLTLKEPANIAEQGNQIVDDLCHNRAAAFRSVCSVFVSGWPRASLIDTVCTQLPRGLYCRLVCWSCCSLLASHPARVEMHTGLVCTRRYAAHRMPRKCCLNKLIAT